MGLPAGANSGACDEALVAAARAGDEQAFRRLTEVYMRELLLHCYRILGSVHDAEDALQETLLRAWRHLAGFEGRSPFRAWLYRIATNVCLRATERRSAQPAPAPTPAGTSTGDGDETIHLSPYPDVLLNELLDTSENPAARYDLRESVQLAFVAAVQMLPPRQRAVLILRDVLGWSAAEVAALLESTTGAVNGALQRARATLEQRRDQGRLRTLRAAPPAEVERSLVERYVQAWEAVDIEALVTLLRKDAVLTMPPFPFRYVGRRAIAEFFARVPAGGALDQIRLMSTRANRQPAVAAYALEPASGTHRAYGLMVLTLDGGAIAEITGFADQTLFPLFGLPVELGD